MLQKLSQEVAECHRRALEARERAAGTTDATVRSSYLDLERRWLLVAKSYEFTRRVTDFNDETWRRIAAFRPATPPHPALPIVTCPHCNRKMRLAHIESLIDGAQQMQFDCACGASASQMPPSTG
jgi:hypothetical protein